MHMAAPLCLQENDWKNGLVMGWLPDNVRSQIPRLVQVCGRQGTSGCGFLLVQPIGLLSLPLPLPLTPAAAARLLPCHRSAGSATLYSVRRCTLALARCGPVSSRGGLLAVELCWALGLTWLGGAGLKARHIAGAAEGSTWHPHLPCRLHLLCFWQQAVPAGWHPDVPGHAGADEGEHCSTGGGPVPAALLHRPRAF